MVGPGTGIAPFRSFWQQAAYEHQHGTDKQEFTLYFGCRNSQMDDIYAHETKVLTKQGILSNVRTAYSREADRPKVIFVNNFIRENCLLSSIKSDTGTGFA